MAPFFKHPWKKPRPPKPLPKPRRRRPHCKRIHRHWVCK